ncbi:glycosyltransferase family 1 protein [Silicimonas algicola]|uniref:Glycosyltransferase involved in cell wall biosynthesis n=1 Tax=Silicimonas algicola TaxID=1826607 RepID=A0A316GFQ3_9RHOB|nr:glycosyltransferase family 4 protein [Silicimonas algicola]AZQ65919.1 glycosyltransferase family 1 protein [Silicimonas algicola]PWK58200.1 glycosyltransferase involved in cell wall biosynthesis [Silicimonas algicola]
MRIFIVETNAKGGLALFAYHMATSLAEQGADVTLLTGREYELGHLPHNFTVLLELDLWSLFEGRSGRSGGKRLGESRTVRRIRRGGKFIRAWAHIVRRLRAENPDVVIFSMIHFPFELYFFHRLRASGLNLIQICHEIEKRDVKRGWFETWFGDPLLKRAYACFSSIVFLASSVERDFVDLYGDISRRVILPHGPPLSLGSFDKDSGVARYGIGDFERVILFFGLLRPSKGVEDLVDAFAALKNRSGVCLLIAGYPTKNFDAEGLIERVRSFGLEGQVLLHLDYVPDGDVGPLLTLAEMLVLPYRNATASGPAAAAQYLHCPIIATDVGGFKEIIQDGVTGRIVPARNIPALSRAIGEMLNDHVGAQRMAEAAYLDQAENRSWNKFAREVLKLAEV